MYTPHRLANRFPMMDAEQIQELADQIKEAGQTTPIVVIGTEILDGRNRYAACLIAEVEPTVREFGSEPGDGPSPVTFVYSQNVMRRHLSTDQKAVIIAELLPDFEAEAAAGNGPGITAQIADAARAMKISPRTAQAAVAVARQDPEEFEKLKAGETSVAAAEKKTRQKKAEKTAAAANPATDKLRGEMEANLRQRFPAEFADGVMKKKIFDDADEIGQWLDTDPKTQLALVPLLMMGYNLKAGLKTLEREPTGNDRLAILIARAAGTKSGKFTATVDGYHISVKKAKDAAESEDGADT